MPKRKQQYRRPPPRPTLVRNNGYAQESLELAAVRLAASQSVVELDVLVRQSRDNRDRADQQAQDNPGAEALHRFREAVLRLAEAERALDIAQQGALSVRP